jgi:probable non-F420 flavinoid oxidoreductase
VTVIGYHCSHEQHPPSRLLRDVVHAADAGFDAAMCSDHLSPWTRAQGESGYAWSWLGAALQATSLPFGVVTAPGQRYHPAVLAQKIATLAELFPGRFWAALGSGENMNEHVTGDVWPPKEDRVARMLECVDVMRRLLDGDEVTHDGLVRVDRARVWSRPAEPPPLVAASVSAESAAVAATWADALITVNQDADALRAVLDAWGGRGPAYVQVHVSWAASDDEARAIALDQWVSATVGSPNSWDLPTVELIEAATRPEEIDAAVIISSDLVEHAARLVELRDLGFDALYLHHVGKEQRPFIDAFAEKVLPDVR